MMIGSIHMEKLIESSEGGGIIDRNAGKSFRMTAFIGDNKLQIQWCIFTYHHYQKKLYVYSSQMQGIQFISTYHPHHD